jgi:hypothetical protein
MGRVSGVRSRRALASVVAVVAQMIVLLVCSGAMYLGMKTNGQVFTETLESTRRETWLVSVSVSALVSVGVLAYALARHRVGLLTFEIIVLAIVIIGAVYFYHLIPVPAGAHTRGIPGP